jgi:hypothetical protein
MVVVKPLFPRYFGYFAPKPTFVDSKLGIYTITNHWIFVQYQCLTTSSNPALILVFPDSLDILARYAIQTIAVLKINLGMVKNPMRKFF